MHHELITDGDLIMVASVQVWIVLDSLIVWCLKAYQDQMGTVTFWAVYKEQKILLIANQSSKKEASVSFT